MEEHPDILLQHRPQGDRTVPRGGVQRGRRRLLALFDGPARAVRCALEVAATVKQLEIEVRAGVHVGECAIMGSDVTGVAIHTGARIMGLAPPGAVWASQTVKDLVAGSGLSFVPQGPHKLKGIAGEHHLYMAVANS